ncbi:MAG: N-formylglutamate amidohydrolase [Rhodospirillaceae bacterium]|nr:N-formylglutamate amidohydrolase [Magnetovibrio sp.]MAY68000.1 N-formylglutamate amidohydrolase [Rhodospirillaceae bacterium]
MTAITDLDVAGVLHLRAAVAPAVPLVFDSPHSGSIYPEDFRPAVAIDALRPAEDSFVDELYDAAPDMGASLLTALFPRLYVDPNRNETDMDPAHVDGPWDGPPLRPGPKAKLGQGLVWMRRPPGLPVYDGKITAADLRSRIETYHRPYHAALRRMLDGTAARFGGYYHVNCHSMPAVATAMSAEPEGTLRPDFVLGTRDGTTTGPALTDCVRSYLSGRGYDVRVDHWYKGVEIVRLAGDPARGRHSLQIEINRRLYMDEERIAKSAGYADMKATITGLIAELRRFAAAAAPGPK